MNADPRFTGLSSSFWAHVRWITEAVGYTARGSGVVRDVSITEMFGALSRLGRSVTALGTSSDPSDMALKLEEYFQFRAHVLNTHVRSDLMTASEAKCAFEEVKESVGAIPTGVEFRSKSTGAIHAVEYLVGDSRVRVPFNKQSGEKRQEAFLTGIVNLLVAAKLNGMQCDYDPHKIPTVFKDGELCYTFSRRYDGSFPDTQNPIAMWEIKEYYYTTTFGSKISDAVYITSLDGYEREELQRLTGVRIAHLVMVDAFDTWWLKGKSYLCRMVDILHMGHVDHLLFGKAVIRELPPIVDGWVSAYRQRSLGPKRTVI